MLTPRGESLYVDCEVRKCTGQCKVGDGLGERNPFLFFKEQNENKRGTNREQNVNVPAEQNVNKQGTKQRALGAPFVFGLAPLPLALVSHNAGSKRALAAHMRCGVAGFNSHAAILSGSICPA